MTPVPPHAQDLEQLFSAYLHQDWPDEHAAANEAVDAFIGDRQGTPALARTLTQLEHLLATTPDAALPDALENLGCAYHPPGDGLTHRAWLTHVAGMLRSSLGR
jgi:hypothetical protein